ncbi:MAG: methyltransferase domain-containing protein [Bryobacteraceae bacterium]|jgi:predicted RNA methylase
MRILSLAILVATAALPSFAQKFGPAENLAPYIPTPQLVVEKMLEAAHVKPGEVVYDLGAGDGRIVIAAAQEFGARAVGVEILPEVCEKARERIKSLGLDDKVTMVQNSALRVDLSPADVVTLYLLTNSNERLKPNLEKYLKPGARVVSNQFPVKGWKAAAVVHVKIGNMDNPIYVYEMGRTK